jgi:hypothetical protein
MSAMRPAETKKDLLEMISDTKDENFPIWRTKNGKDECSTLATVLFDVGEKEVTVFGKRPAIPSSPLPASSPPSPNASPAQVEAARLSDTVLIFDWQRPDTWEAVLRG